jgi:hypothetical protein
MSQQMQYQPVPPGPTGVQGPQAARNGLGVTALVLGIIGALSGIPMLLFWLAGPLGVLALIFGLIGFGRARKGGATNKGVALTGTILGVIALILSVVGAVVTLTAVNEAVDEVHEQVEKSGGQPQDDSGKSAKNFGPGDTAGYNNGLKVSVSKPTPYTVDPSTLISGHKDGNKPYKVTVKIKNTGKKAFDADLVQVKGRTGADGRKAEELMDDKVGPLKGFSGSIGAGDAATVDVVFDTEPTAKDLDVEDAPDILLDSVHWKLTL